MIQIHITLAETDNGTVDIEVKPEAQTEGSKLEKIATNSIMTILNTGIKDLI